MTPPQPYRPAVLHVVAAPGGKVLSENWDLKDRKAWVGAWHDSALRARLARSEVTAARVVIEFHRAGPDKFAGGTSPDRKFANAFKGAATFTNVSELTARLLYSWDRGWKEDGTLAWGPADGGYIFDKIPSDH